MATTEMPTLHGDRVRVRPLAPSDLEAYLDACRTLEDGVSEDDLRVRLNWRVAGYRELGALLQPPYGERAIVLRESGHLVGLCGLVPSLGPFGLLASWPREADTLVARRFVPAVGLYWLVDTRHRGCGYATEAATLLIRHAFEQMHLRRVVATTLADNASSQAVMRRLGMRIERNPEPEPEWFQVVGILDS
ncbi:MAG TPA: GNAT family N-acetyltransferase [Gaiellales bacterium]|nr:GNAT family N-acetyltransferase [Gaiellales bacterium]